MALWSTLEVHSDRPDELDRLMQKGIEGYEVAKWKPGVYVVSGPKAQEVLDELAARAGLKISTRVTDILDLE